MTSLLRIAQLKGLAYSRPDLLLNDRDFHFLADKHKLKPLAKQLRRERREIVLSWLRFLQEDMNTLWRIWRFLVRQGAPTTLRNELEIVMRSMIGNTFLYSLRLIVALTGPFVLSQAIRLAHEQVNNAFNLCADLLARMPSMSLAQLERRWAAENS